MNTVNLSDRPETEPASEQTEELSTINTPSPVIDARAPPSQYVQNAPAKSRLISKNDMPLKNLTDSLEAASASVRRPANPEAASDQNAARPVFSANELEALMRGPVAPTNVQLPTQTMIINAATIQDMQELLIETKQQLRLRNQQI